MLSLKEKLRKTEMLWNWLTKGDLKRETESLLIAAQDQVLNTNSVKKDIYNIRWNQQVPVMQRESGECDSPGQCMQNASTERIQMLPQQSLSKLTLGTMQKVWLWSQRPLVPTFAREGIGWCRQASDLLGPQLHDGQGNWASEVWHWSLKKVDWCCNPWWPKHCIEGGRKGWLLWAKGWGCQNVGVACLKGESHTSCDRSTGANPSETKKLSGPTGHWLWHQYSPEICCTGNSTHFEEGTFCLKSLLWPDRCGICYLQY